MSDDEGSHGGPADDQHADGSEVHESGNEGSADSGADERITGKKRKRVVASELTAEKLKEFEEAERRKGVVSCCDVSEGPFDSLF
jgi:hypothetical protein